MVKSSIVLPARSRYAVRVFENKQIAISQKTGSWYLVLGTWGVRRCDPLPTGQLERENRAEIDRDWSP
jgi:hypothetical protein